MRKSLALFLVCCAFYSCDPVIEDPINLGAPPAVPEFSMEYVAGDANRVVITDLSSGSFDRLWSMPGGTPNVSKLQSDTVFYSQAGSYDISLIVSGTEGGGTAVNTKTVDIENTVALQCDLLSELLTGCNTTGKTWIFSQEAGAIAVGPNPFSTEWFASPAGGLVPEQYDDAYTFNFDSGQMIYTNNDLSVDPCSGYEALPFSYSEDIFFTLIPGGGTDGLDRITLPDEAFIGVRDSGPFYDVVEITESIMVLHGPQVPCSPGDSGWFTLKFTALP